MAFCHPSEADVSAIFLIQRNSFLYRALCFRGSLGKTSLNLTCKFLPLKDSIDFWVVVSFGGFFFSLPITPKKAQAQTQKRLLSQWHLTCCAESHVHLHLTTGCSLQAAQCWDGLKQGRKEGRNKGVKLEEWEPCGVPHIQGLNVSLDKL